MAAVVAVFNKHFMRYCGSKRKFMKIKFFLVNLLYLLYIITLISLIE